MYKCKTFLCVTQKTYIFVHFLYDFLVFFGHFSDVFSHFFIKNLRFFVENNSCKSVVSVFYGRFFFDSYTV